MIDREVSAAAIATHVVALRLAGRDGRLETRQISLDWDPLEWMWRSAQPIVAVSSGAGGRIHHRFFRWPAADPDRPELGPAPLMPIERRTPDGLLEIRYPTRIPQIDAQRPYLVVGWADAMAATGDPRHDDLPMPGRAGSEMDARRSILIDLPFERLADLIALGRDPFGEIIDSHSDDPMLVEALRDKLAHRFAYGLPDPAIIDTLLNCGPLVEIGAGTGYWAALIRAHGGDIVAYEQAIPGQQKNSWHHDARPWTRLRTGNAEVVAAHPDRTLLLICPSGSPMAAQALSAHRGLRLAYVGEGRGGANADDSFFELLDRDVWQEVSRVWSERRWPRVTDQLVIYARKRAPVRKTDGTADPAAALAFAAAAHSGQFRTGSDIPYLVHPVGTALLLREHYPGRAELEAAGYLHDVLEDCGVSVEELTARFGPAVAELVASVTRTPGWKIEDHSSPDILRLKVADTLDNTSASLRDMRAGEDVWSRFAAGRAKLTGWQRTATVARSILGGEPMVYELDDVLKSIANEF